MRFVFSGGSVLVFFLCVLLRRELDSRCHRLVLRAEVEVLRCGLCEVCCKSSSIPANTRLDSGAAKRVPGRLRTIGEEGPLLSNVTHTTTSRDQSSHL